MVRITSVMLLLIFEIINSMQQIDKAI